MMFLEDTGKHSGLMHRNEDDVIFVRIRVGSACGTRPAILCCMCLM